MDRMGGTGVVLRKNGKNLRKPELANDLDKSKNWAAQIRDRKPPRVGVDWPPDAIP